MNYRDTLVKKWASGECDYLVEELTRTISYVSESRYVSQWYDALVDYAAAYREGDYKLALHHSDNMQYFREQLSQALYREGAGGNYTLDYMLQVQLQIETIYLINGRDI